MDDLTNEQKRLLVSMYKYVLSLQPAMPPEKANFFLDSNTVRDLFLPNSSSEYVSSLCWKLKSKDYIDCHPGDNLALQIRLSDKTIVFMENRFLRDLKKISHFLVSLR